MPTIEISDKTKEYLDKLMKWLPGDSYDEIIEFLESALDMEL